MHNIDRFKDLKSKLNNIRKYSLGFFPTPMHKLERLSSIYGVNIYIKRDDLTGFSTFGGNKIRKLEYLFGDIELKGSKYVFTYGATQSNHAMLTALAARKYGIKPILYLVDMLDEKDKFPKANLLLDHILGGEIDIISIKENEETFQSMARAMDRSKAHIDSLTKDENDCYIIPPGGATAIGTLGFVNAYLEMKEDEKRQGIKLDHIFHATGTGGTMAGLVGANSYLEDKIKINGINVIHEDESYIETVLELAKKALKALGIEKEINRDNINIDPNYVGQDYEKPTYRANRAIRLFAKEEGIFLDPVYTGKAASAMIDYLEKGHISKGANILFWHTGGTNALFADKKLLGNLID